jgi:large subunit ribosomal protein L6
MSRIGKQPIAVPSGLNVTIDGLTVTVKGPKGELTRTFPEGVSIGQEEDALHVRRASDEQHHRALHGLARALLANMVTGVTDGFEKTLEIVGTGYRADEDGKAISLVVGYSHPVRVDPPEHITFTVQDRGKRVIVQGIDKEVVGQVAVDLRRVRPPEPYKGKGIRYLGEHVPLKAGKSGKGKKG